MTDYPQPIIIDGCQNCEHICCLDLPTIVCAYNGIDAIMKGKIPVEAVKKMIVYRIQGDYIDVFAQKWGLYPLDNFLTHMTLKEDGFYEILTFPRGVCVLLDSGCKYPEMKSYECGLYPFEIYKMQMFPDRYFCEPTNFIRNDMKYREIAGKYTIQYLLYSEEHKNAYFQDLKAIKDKFGIQTIEAIDPSI